MVNTKSLFNFKLLGLFLVLLLCFSYFFYPKEYFTERENDDLYLRSKDLFVKKKLTVNDILNLENQQQKNSQKGNPYYN